MMNNSQGASSFFSGLSTLLGRPHPLLHNLSDTTLANGKTVAMVSRELGINEQTYYRWRQEFGGMKVDQARRFKELEKENARLKRAVANLTVDKLILEEATKGNF